MVKPSVLIRRRGDRSRVSIAFTKPSKALQSAKDECDINKLMLRYQRTGLINHVNRYEGSYGDFTGSPSDYQSALNQVMAARAMFDSLPSGIRSRFGNNPAAFIDFVSDDANRAEMASMGLLRPVETPPAPPPSPLEGGGA